MMRKKRFLTSIAAICFAIIIQQPCAADQPLKIAYGDALPPWVIPATNSGILLDLARKTLEPEGYDVVPVYVPYARRLAEYKHKKVNAVCDINPNIVADSGLEGYLSEIAYAYENIGVSLKKNGYNFKRISDLAGYHVLAWQGAKAAIGGEYAEMASNNKNYREMAEQGTQIKLLYFGREDVIQLDRQIFKYFRKKVGEEGKIDTSQPVDIFPLFGKNKCGFMFRDKAARDAFNKNLALLKESGEYQKIFEKYTQ